MALTRNLYREDEVLAALQFCILRGRIVEAVFWACEVLDSGMVNEFLSALRTIWRLGFGIGAIGWYLAFQAFAAEEDLDYDKAIQLVVSLCRIGVAGGRDNSVIVLAGTRAQPEQVTLCMVPKGLNGVDSFFAAAVLQGRTITAWRALPSISDGVIARTAAFKHGEYGSRLLEIDSVATCLAAMCLPRGELEKRFIVPPGTLSEVDEALAEWEGLVGRERRVYPIPAQSLYWITARGKDSVYASTEGQMRGSLERPGRLWGSIYWDQVVEDMGGWEAVRNNDSVREEFYDQHFPDDIPDEWSSDARRLSHGSGVLQPNSAASLSRFLRTWFGACISSVIWNQFDSAVEGIDVKNLEELDAAIGTPVALNLQRIRVKVHAS